MRGNLVSVNRTYGFVRTAEGDVFVHYTECDFRLCDALIGDVLEFPGVKNNGRGLRAKPMISWVKREGEA